MTESTLPDVIQAMLKPEFYPHPVSEPIELMQTHVSYVLLTGDYVYKLKKPVNFGFLDYSTLDKRKHFCEEEIRLNQRGAKELYLEVLPISAHNGKLGFGNDGEIVDYALKMVQFPQENLLSNMFAAGTITEAHIEEMGKIVADFHAGAATSDYISSFGQVSKVRESVDENYQQTEKYIGLAQTQQQFDETKAYTDRIFSQRPELFTNRRDGGFIRECHGDLHLRNICLSDGKIRLFDCIEFNEPFRFVDTMYDVAFAVMDLEARGRKDLANRFLNTYVEQTGDWEGLQVLPLYLSRQAYVRAKVTSFLLDDAGIPQADKDAAAQTAGDYYRQAWAYTSPKQGKIIMLSGLSGAGKSTLGKQIAKETGGIHLRSDAVRKHLGGIPLSAKGDDKLYSPAMTAQTYLRLLELGTTLAQQGYTVILDAKYDRVSLRQPVIDMAKSQNTPLQILHCTAPEEVLRDRLNKRQGDIADATADLLASQLAAWEGFTDTEQPYVTTIDTTQDRG
jgi:aminoglycoside phosphotransferase family enzyme/predicted kinase